MRLLLIGPMPPPLGGATILFRQLAEELVHCRDLEVTTIDTSRGEKGWLPAIRSLLKVLTVAIIEGRRTDVISFHASRRGLLFLGPAMCLISKAFEKALILRGFGGNYDGWYRTLPTIKKFLMQRAIAGADRVLLETHSSVEYFREKFGCRIEWYPNSRKITEETLGGEMRVRNPRFVYLGHVLPEKGIFDIIAASSILPDGIQIDVYGPLLGGLKNNIFDGKRVRYRASVDPANVMEVLRRYDVMLMPTYSPNEGYPGAILEAYSAGLCVIATRWISIPEIVDDSCGILIAPRSPERLADAMLTLVRSPEYLLKLKKGALSAAKKFSSTKWTEKFYEMCIESLHERKQAKYCTKHHVS